MNLLSNTIPAATPSFVTEVTTANFVAAVVQASMQAPVVAFFWSPRSPGCKAYGEALAKQINALGGAVTLARINIDSNMQIAAQLRIESVPTTYIFQQGQPVDGFAGAIDDKAIAQLLQPFSGGAPSAEPPMDAMLAEAEALAQNGHTAEALKYYNALYARAPENAKLVAGFVRLKLQQKDNAGAKALLDGLPATVKDASLDAVRAQLKLIENAGDGDVAMLEKAVQNNPQDFAKRYQLAGLLFAQGEQERGIEQLLAIIAGNAEWEERKARTQLLTFFEALGFSHPLSVNGRRKLSSLLFS